MKIFTFCINQGPKLVMDLFGRRGASSLEAEDHGGQAITAAAGLATAKGGQMIGSAASGVQSGAAAGKSLYAKGRAMLSKGTGTEGGSSGGNGRNGGIADIAAKE